MRTDVDDHRGGAGIQTLLRDIERDVVAAEPGDTEPRDEGPLATGRGHPAATDEHEPQQHRPHEESRERQGSPTEVRRDTSDDDEGARPGQHSDDDGGEYGGRERVAGRGEGTGHPPTLATATGSRCQDRHGAPPCPQCRPVSPKGTTHERPTSPEPTPVAESRLLTSERGTLGIEWELALVDHKSGELAPAAPDILDALRMPDGSDNPCITAELLTNTVEIVTGVHRTVPEGLADLRESIEAVRTVAEPMGVDIMCSGTHPFSQWFEQQVTAKARYATLIDRTQWWGRQMMIWGVHVHVGIEDRDKVLPIMNGLLTWYPHFQALSASSPYWAGEATGYASSRAMLFQQLPTAGLPPQFGAWGNYEQMVDDMLHVGVIDHYNELRWDIRPVRPVGHTGDAGLRRARDDAGDRSDRGAHTVPRGDAVDAPR